MEPTYYNVWIEIEAMVDGDPDQALSQQLTFDIDGAACYRTNDKDDAVAFACRLQALAGDLATRGRPPVAR